MIAEILVPVDGSENAERAIDFAADLAAKYGARIWLLHVLEQLPSRKQLKHYLKSLEAEADPDEGEIETIKIVLSKSGETEAQDLLDRAAQKMRGMAVKEVDLIIADGDPATAVLRYIKSKRADVVVMGRRGLGGLKGLLMGSVSQKIASMAECPVIVVK